MSVFNSLCSFTAFNVELTEFWLHKAKQLAFFPIVGFEYNKQQQWDETDWMCAFL